MPAARCNDDPDPQQWLSQHLNGYKISGPTVEARLPEEELLALYRGHGCAPYLVARDDEEQMHQWFAATLDRCYAERSDVRGADYHLYALLSPHLANRGGNTAWVDDFKGVPMLFGERDRHRARHGWLALSSY
jgi:hypothetical protein